MVVTNKGQIKEMLKKISASPYYNIAADIIRFFLIALLLLILFILIKEIEVIKLLAYDPCELCINKTGAVCFLPFE